MDLWASFVSCIIPSTQPHKSQKSNEDWASRASLTPCFSYSLLSVLRTWVIKPESQSVKSAPLLSTVNWWELHPRGEALLCRQAAVSSTETMNTSQIHNHRWEGSALVENAKRKREAGSHGPRTVCVFLPQLLPWRRTSSHTWPSTGHTRLYQHPLQEPGSSVQGFGQVLTINSPITPGPSKKVAT